MTIHETSAGSVCVLGAHFRPSSPKAGGVPAVGAGRFSRPRGRRVIHPTSLLDFPRRAPAAGGFLRGMA